MSSACPWAPLQKQAFVTYLLLFCLFDSIFIANDIVWILFTVLVQGRGTHLVMALMAVKCFSRWQEVGVSASVLSFFFQFSYRISTMMILWNFITSQWHIETWVRWSFYPPSSVAVKTLCKFQRGQTRVDHPICSGIMRNKQNNFQVLVKWIFCFLAEMTIPFTLPDSCLQSPIISEDTCSVTHSQLFNIDRPRI